MQGATTVVQGANDPNYDTTVELDENPATAEEADFIFGGLTTWHFLFEEIVICEVKELRAHTCVPIIQLRYSNHFCVQ